MNIQNWKIYKLSEVLKYRNTSILIDDNLEYKRITVKLHNQGVVLRDIVKGSEINTKKQKEVKANDLIVAEIDAKVGGIGIIPSELEGAVVSSHYFLFDININILDINFLNYWIKKGEFQSQIMKYVKGSTNYAAIRYHNVLDCNIQLPPIEEQKEIASKIEKIENNYQNIKKNTEQIQYIMDLEFPLSFLYKKSTATVPLGLFLKENTEKIGKDYDDFKKIGVDNKLGIVPLRISKKVDFSKYKIVRKNNFIYNPMRVNVGSIGLYEKQEIAITSPDYVVFEIKKDISPLILLKFLKSSKGLEEINNNTKGSVRERLYFKGLSKVNFPNVTEKEMFRLEKLLYITSKIISKQLDIEKNLNSFFSLTLNNAFIGKLRY